jgi:hypothetical protein
MHHGYDRRCVRRPAPTDAEIATPLALPPHELPPGRRPRHARGPGHAARRVRADSTPLGWDAVYAIEGEHGIILPEPYRSFVATIGDGSYSGPPDYGLMEFGVLPPDWGRVDRSGIWASRSR